MSRALRGINLGGWLVTERWMTPSIYDGVRGDGELVLMEELGDAEAGRRIQAHRDTFITVSDLRLIKQSGFDFIRLPVGYWCFERVDGVTDGERYIDMAFAWAEQSGLKVVLDFHGLQGSQNGYDHSGRAGRVKLYRARNVTESLRTLAYMCDKYGHYRSLLAIELINEPKIHICLRRLLYYYDHAYRTAAQRIAPDIKIIVSDALQPVRVARALSQRRYDERLVLDVHLYQLFNKHYQDFSPAERIEYVQRDWKRLLRQIEQYVPVMVGEWSAALPGRPGVDRETMDKDIARYYAVQQQTFDECSWAHAYWSYRAPGAGAWSWIDSQEILHAAHNT